MTLALFSMLLHYKYSKGEPCGHSIMNQYMEFDQTSTDTSSGWVKEVIRFWWPWPYFQGRYIITTQKGSIVCTLSSFLHILINVTRNLLNIFCINVDIHEMLLLQKKKGQGISTVIVIPLRNSIMSITLLFFLSILLDNFRNLVIFYMNADIGKLLLWKFFNILNRAAIYTDQYLELGI